MASGHALRSTPAQLRRALRVTRSGRWLDSRSEGYSRDPLAVPPYLVIAASGAMDRRRRWERSRRHDAARNLRATATPERWVRTAATRGACRAPQETHRVAVAAPSRPPGDPAPTLLKVGREHLQMLWRHLADLGVDGVEDVGDLVGDRREVVVDRLGGAVSGRVPASSSAPRSQAARGALAVPRPTTPEHRCRTTGLAPSNTARRVSRGYDFSPPGHHSVAYSAMGR
jgi:hypothetical protein